MHSGSILLIGLLAFCISVIPGVVARCGYPDLPYMAQISSDLDNLDVFQNWNYFEENQMVKVVCESALIGYWTNISVSNSVHKFTIQPYALIECSNNRWNVSNLYCVQSLNLHNPSTEINGEIRAISGGHQLQSKILDKPLTLVDNNALTCMDIGYSRNQTTNEQTFVFSVKLNPVNKRLVSRVVLTLQHLTPQEPYPGLEAEPIPSEIDPNLTPLENLIMNMNHQSTDLADNHSEEGNVEVEEAKRFLDFVYFNEFANDTHSPKMVPLSSGGKNNEHKQRVIVSANLEWSLSVKLGTSDDSGPTRDCHFNENVAVGEHNVSTEFLIFDCHFSDTVDDKVDLVWIQVNVRKLNDRNQSNEKDDSDPSQDAIRLCGVEVFATADHNCGKPYVPIYGLVTQTKQQDGRLMAEYSCVSGYRLANLSRESQHELNSLADLASNGSNDIETRTCDQRKKQWMPDFDDVICVPLYSCRRPPPMPDPAKFFYEFAKLDNMKRAVADSSTAILRCQMLIDYVVPYTVYRCDQSGQWVRLGKDTDAEPQCRSALYRNRRIKGSHYYHHYYHYYQSGSQSSSNRTTLLFGRQLNDNKYLTYYGAAALVVLFGGSFIILFHVRRMAKKISRQMRERAYIQAEKGGSDSFLPMNVSGSFNGNGGGSGGMSMDGNLPPYYSNETNYYDTNTQYSNDLPPPATPISMPTTFNHHSDSKERNNLSNNFDSIKF